jgi:hypothetical protein
MPVAYNFLSSGPLYTLGGHPAFDALLNAKPTMSTVLDWGAGGREVGFDAGAPSTIPFHNPAFARVGSGTSPFGDTYEVFHRAEDPGGWVIRWLVPYGVFTTHVREMEGADTVKVVLGGLAWQLAASGLPMAVLSPPLTVAVSKQPGFQEHVSWSVSGTTDAMSIVGVELTRPGALGAGEERYGLAGDASVVTVGTPHGFDASVVIARNTPLANAKAATTHVTRDAPSTSHAADLAASLTFANYAQPAAL